jgi:hypothetical protein
MRSPDIVTLLNVAAQVKSRVIVIVLPQPVPDQPENAEPAAAVAVSATSVPLVKLWLQSPPQLIPGAVTVPLPLPALDTVRVKEFRVKMAVQVMFPMRVTVPLAQPLPVQPVNVDPFAATAAKTICVPLLAL